VIDLTRDRLPKHTPVIADSTTYWPCTDEVDNPFNAPVRKDDQLYEYEYCPCSLKEVFRWFVHFTVPPMLVNANEPIQYAAIGVDGKFGVSYADFTNGSGQAKLVPVVKKNTSRYALAKRMIAGRSEPISAL